MKSGSMPLRSHKFNLKLVHDYPHVMLNLLTLDSSTVIMAKNVHCAINSVFGPFLIIDQDSEAWSGQFDYRNLLWWM